MASLKKYSLILCFLINYFAFAQDQIAYKIDRYSGINAVTTSPTAFLNNPSSYDVNLVSIAALIQTNYAYYSDASVIRVLSNIDDLQFSDRANGINGEIQPLVFDFSDSSDNKFLYFGAEVLGPSVGISFKDKKYSAGLFTRARVGLSGVRIDEGYNYFNFLNSNFGNVFTAGQGKISGMAWFEVGASFAMVYRDRTDHKINIGINAKYLSGVEGFYLDSDSDFDITLNENMMTTATGANIRGSANIEIAYTEALNLDGNFEFQENGSGFGLDFGVSYIKKPNKGIGGYKPYNYDSKWEVNLLDLGFINFDNSFQHLLESNFNGVTDIVNFPTSVDSLQGLFQDLSTQIYGNPNQSLIGNSFIIGLPTAINVKHDRKVNSNWYINYQWTQRLPIFANSLKRPNLLAFTPRYENQWFGISLTFNLFDYRRFQIGGHLRLGPLYLGTNNVIPFVFQSQELNSTDIYFGIKIYPFLKRKRSFREGCDFIKK